MNGVDEMQIPSKVKILGITYDIEEVDVINREIFRLGEINYVSSKIKILSDLSVEKKEETLLHEIYHGIFNALEMDYHDEVTIQKLAAVLHQIIKDNPKLFL
jgi:hypothetical protein